jgi:dTDP-4-dehydrorhamnose reductase
MGKDKALIIGAAGQVGLELQRHFAGFGEVIACDRETADLQHPEMLENLVEQARPRFVLLAAAYTAVDKAESEPALAMAINAEAPGVLARACAKRDAVLIHYSTDYVFDGTKTAPWLETDEPGPLNVYGRSKLAGERAIQESGCKHLIFRTSWVYGPHGKNFYLTMLRLAREKDQIGIVADQIGAPTSSYAIAEATRKVVDGLHSGELEASQVTGIYHFTCRGSASWFDFAEHIFASSLDFTGGKKPLVKPLETRDYPTPARRPQNSLLDSSKLAQVFGVELPSWQDAFERVQWMHRHLRTVERESLAAKP